MFTRAACLVLTVILSVISSFCLAVQSSDFNLDCDVDFVDFAGLAEAWLSDTEDPGWDDKYDVDLSGAVDINDIEIFADRWLTQRYENGTIYVDASARAGGDGSRWKDAFDELGDALAVAQCGWQILVADGTYRPGSSRADTFRLKSGVAVRGGYRGGDSITGDQRDPAIYTSILNGCFTSYHVVTASDTDETALLEGFTITGGLANGSDSNECGGGLYNYAGSAKIRDCIFIKDGLYYNQAAKGGAVYNCLSDSVYENCVFYYNKGLSGTVRYGGGAYNENSQASFINCVFADNEEIDYGAALAFVDCNYSAVINCTFYSNSASENSDGFYIINSSPVIANCILWEVEPIYSDANSQPDVSFCVVKGDWPGITNIDSCPRFIDSSHPKGSDGKFLTADDGLNIGRGSPCCDVASDEFAWGEDILGRPRTDTIIGIGTADTDIGAYECQEGYTYEVPSGLFAATTGSVEKYIGGADGNQWDSIISPDYFCAYEYTLGGASIYSLCEYNGHLYASDNVYGYGGVWRYDGEGAWNRVAGNFDNYVACMAVYRNSLYAGVSSSINSSAPPPAKLYRYDGGTKWTKVVDTADMNDVSDRWHGFRSMGVWNDVLYLGNIFDPLFGYFDGNNFTDYYYDSNGCGITDFEVYDGNLFASIWAAPSADSAGGVFVNNGQGWICHKFEKDYEHVQACTSLEVFKGELYLGDGDLLKRFAGYGEYGEPRYWDTKWTKDSGDFGVNAMTKTQGHPILGDMLVFALGYDHFLYSNPSYPMDAKSIYIYDGNDPDSIRLITDENWDVQDLLFLP
ncbi:MAG: right-handed parallel beta-helix repeat-containing protein [Phycisphaerae bacterium]